MVSSVQFLVTASEGATILAITVVPVVIILVIIIVGVVILVVLFKRRKQQSEFINLQNVVKRKKCIE